MADKLKRRLTGLVTKAKMQKTVIVEVQNIKVHQKYHKRYKVTKKYPAHAEESFAVGDKVEIEESKPLSKTKNWKVIRKIT
jgi:small subunit ribosomal protein S17